MRSAKYSFFFSACSSVLLRPFFLVTWLGCGNGVPDPHTVRGALAATALALEAQDAARLFHLIDQRARHALASIVVSRKQARRAIEADYPENERAAALSALGDGALVASAEELFGRRCAGSCMAALATQVGAPVAELSMANEVEVHTSRGSVLHMHAGTDGWYGLVWHTAELIDERAHAAHDALAISDNAAVYRKRRQLEAAAH